MKNGKVSMGSLDMLLDTMCNTFGGVCFIALMVAILSALLPVSTHMEESSAEQTEQMLVDRETTRLKRERDELVAAVEIQRTFLSANLSKGADKASQNDLIAGIASNETARLRLESERRELEDRLAKATTDVSYSRREALRLERLLKDLDEKLGAPSNLKQRAVRTPVERELADYDPLDVWLHSGRLYCLWNEQHVNCLSEDTPSGHVWTYRLKLGTGYRMSDDFVSSYEYRQLLGMLSGKKYLRVFTDIASFPQLCEIRDNLILHRKMYNWHVREQTELHFVEGHDGRVQ